MYSVGGVVVVVVGVVVVVSIEFTELKLNFCLTENYFFKNMGVFLASKLENLTDLFLKILTFSINHIQLNPKY